MIETAEQPRQDGAIVIKSIQNKYPRASANIELFALGSVSALGFAPINFWYVTIVCFALLMKRIYEAPSPKQAASLAWFFGIGHFTFGLNWIAVAFTFQAAMPEWLGYLAVILLAMFLAVFPALVALAANSTSKKSPLSFSLAFASLWILAELLRSILFSGFAWNPLAVISLPIYGLPKITTVIGTYGLSGLMILFAALSWRLSEKSYVFAIALIGAVALLSTLIQPSVAPIPATQPALHIVQPNIGQQDKWQAGFERRNFERLAKLTQSKSKKPRIIFWPEAAIPNYLEKGYPYRYYYQRPEYTRSQLADLMQDEDVLVLGALSLEFNDDGQAIGARNAAFAMNKQQELLSRYDKSHLVPFGEYLPMRALLTPLGLSRLVPGDLDFWPGPGPRNLDLGNFGKAGIQICYEIIFSGNVVNPNNRPDFIFNPSNDAWFGKSGPPQHLAQTRLRAIEEGLPIIRSTPTGISAVIDAEGNVLKSLPWQKEGKIETLLPEPKPPTFFARHGNLVPLIFALILMILAIAIRNRAR